MERLTITQKLKLPQSYLDLLRQQMDAKGINQYELADAIGMKQPNVNAVLQGRQGISEENFKALAKVLGLGAISRLEVDLYRLR